MNREWEESCRQFRKVVYMVYLANTTGSRLDEEELWPLPSDTAAKARARAEANNDAFFDALDREIARVNAAN